MPKWNEPIVLKLPSGEILPARVSGLDLDGKGKGEIGVYIYTKRFMTPNTAMQYGPDDIGQDHEYVDEASGIGRYGQIINAPDILHQRFDPKTGREYLFTWTELQQKLAEARAGAPAAAPPGKQRVTLDVEPGKATVVSVG